MANKNFPKADVCKGGYEVGFDSVNWLVIHENDDTWHQSSIPEPEYA